MTGSSRLLVAGAFVAGALSVSAAPSLSRDPNPPTARTGQVRLLVPEAIQTISQSTSTTVVAGSIACNTSSPDFFHLDNSYYRGMRLSTFPALTLPQFLVQQVTIGVQQANAAGTGTSQPILLRTWKATANPIDGAPNPPGNNQTSSDVFNVSDQTLSLLPLTITTQPVYLVASEILAVEIFTPSGQAAGHRFYIGSNASGQTGPSYLKAGACSIPNISDLAVVGFPGMHIVMQVLGNNQTPVELQTFGVE